MQNQPFFNKIITVVLRFNKKVEKNPQTGYNKKRYMQNRIF